MSDPTTTPVDIAIERKRAVTITFADHTVCEFPVDALRAACPCATCRGRRERGEVAWPQRGAINIVHAELNGAWGLSITWSDGHDTGIYAWTVLRRWWDNGMVADLVSEAVDRPAADTEPR